jgi:hypothetical protein
VIVATQRSAEHKDKLRSFNTLGFVSFILLLGSLVISCASVREAWYVWVEA